MLAAGVFVAAGDMKLVSALAAGVGGEVAGDQAGYLLGAVAGPWVIESIGRRRSMRTALASARRFSRQRGRLAVFLSRGQVSPLRPPINLVSETVGMRWSCFSTAGVLGELVWVTIYIGLGAAFGRSIIGLAEILDDLTWFLAAGVVAAFLLLRLVAHGRAASRPA